MLTAAILATIREAIETAGIPGIAGAVIDGDRRIQTFAQGLADIADRRKVEDATAFRLYSGTKIVTATAIMQLVDRGLVEVDAPVRRYLPELFGTDDIRILHLLNHTSGLNDTLKAFLAVHPSGSPAVSSAEALSRFRLGVSGPAGALVRYRNVNYALLGEVVSRVSGLPYEDFVVANILRPLSMRASFGLVPRTFSDSATGYVAAFGALWLLGPWMVPGVGRRNFGRRQGLLREIAPYDLDASAIGGLAGPAAAFVPFLDLHLNGNDKVLSPGSRIAMQTQTASGAAGIMSKTGVGLGWKLGDADGTPFINHEGGGPGFTAELRLYPHQKLGIVLLMNRWALTPGTHRTAHRICEVLRRGLGS